MSLAHRLVGALVCAASLMACDSDSAPDETDAGIDGGALVDDPGFEPVPCTVEPPTSCPDPAPRFADVQPIFKQRCSSCHASDWTGPWPLDTYSHVADWADVIRAHLLDCTMPPPEAGMPLPDEESTTILTWIRCNTPR